MSKIFKRISPLLLILALLPSLIVSAAASTFNPGYIKGIDVLEYVTADGDNSMNTGSSKVAKFDYTLPYKSIYTYVDAVVSTASGFVYKAYGGTVGSAIDSSGKSQLTISRFGSDDRLHRIYGIVPSRNYAAFELYIQSNTTDVSVNIISLKLSNQKVTYHEEVGTLGVLDHNGSRTYTQTSFGGLATHSIAATSGGNLQLTGVATLRCPNWINYDFIEFSGSTTNSSISSVTAVCDLISVPYTITYFGDPVSDALDSANGRRDFIISLDLREIDRTTDSYPLITMNFTYPESQGGSFILSRVHGIINEDNVSSELFLLRKVYEYMQTGFANLITAVEGLNTTLNSQTTQLMSGLQAINTSISNLDFEGLGTEIVDAIEAQTADLKTQFSQLKTKISNEFTSLKTTLHTEFEVLGDDISQSLTREFTALQTMLHSEFEELSSVITSSINSFSSSVTNLFSQLILVIQTEFTNITNFIRDQFFSLKLALSGHFQALSDQLQELFGQDPVQSEEDQEDMIDQGDEIGGLNEEIESVTKPSVEDVQVSVDDIISPEDIAQSTQVFTLILSNNIFLSVCMMSLILALGSYVLFGKRG